VTTHSIRRVDPTHGSVASSGRQPRVGSIRCVSFQCTTAEEEREEEEERTRGKIINSQLLRSVSSSKFGTKVKCPLANQFIFGIRWQSNLTFSIHQQILP
jgi:hypothetical protein